MSSSPAKDLLDACQHGDLSCVAALLEEHPVDALVCRILRKGYEMYAPAAVDSLGRNALMVSSARGDTACVNIVAATAQKIDQQYINECDRNGNTALFIACTNNFSECAKILLEHGAEVDDKGGKMVFYTPLIQCAKLGHVECARVLIDFDANVNEVQDMGAYNGMTVADIARLKGHFDIERMLVQA